ncbi:hypothetical protein C9374_010849 [Naegleria lovaniensis]|uniref:RGS domain-containing protein n=1 Tax=Naegleria lovaniensis TaxID=51637 RepID=A0AA88GGQ5_NAELO|nr:uncharacterized protein C9374_010849 [Naegleria lovaniensis]KAG2374279.1 hypothetical protein C9374_010849 [Naegleria lovaniensis]
MMDSIMTTMNAPNGSLSNAAQFFTLVKEMTKCYSIKFNEFLERGREDDFVMAFREFLTCEHNDMTLDLIYEIEDFKLCPKEDYKKRFKKAKKMIQWYIRDDSSRQVNLPATLKDQCMSEFEKSTISKNGNHDNLSSLEAIFDKIYTHLHYSLKSDNFFRFTSSDLFVKCILQNLQILKQKLQNSNMSNSSNNNNNNQSPPNSAPSHSNTPTSPRQQDSQSQQLWNNVLELFFLEIGEKKLLPSNLNAPNNNGNNYNNTGHNNGAIHDSSPVSSQSQSSQENDSNVTNHPKLVPSQFFLIVNSFNSSSDSQSSSPNSLLPSTSPPPTLSPRGLNQQLLTKDLTQLALELDEILEEPFTQNRMVHEKHFRFIHSLAMSNNLFTKLDPPIVNHEKQENTNQNGSNAPVASMNWTCAYTADLKHPKKKKSYRLFKQTGILNASPLEVLYSILDAEYSRIVGDQMNEESNPLEYVSCDFSTNRKRRALSNPPLKENGNSNSCENMTSCQEDEFHSTWATRMLFKLGFPLKSREFLVSMSLRNETLAMWDLNGTRSEKIFREICKDPYSNFTLVRAPYQYNEDKIDVVKNHTRGIFFGGTIIEKVSENQTRFTLVSHINMNTKIPTSLYYSSAQNRTVEVISSIQSVVEILRNRKYQNSTSDEHSSSESLSSSSETSSNMKLFPTSPRILENHQIRNVIKDTE